MGDFPWFVRNLAHFSIVEIAYLPFGMSMWQKSKFLPYSTFPVVKNKWLCAFKWDVFAVRFYSQIYFAQGCYSYLMLVANWKVQLLELKKKHWFCGRLLFWSDWSSPPRIERSHMDGSSRQVLVTTNIAWPNGITLDLPNRCFISAYRLSISHKHLIISVNALLV